MFIKSSGSGYSKDGQQFCRGSFLLLFSHNGYKWEEQNNVPRVKSHGETTDGKTCQCRGSGITAYNDEDGAKVPAYYLKYCPAHGNTYKTWAGDDKKLYACVRHVSLRQLGQFMTGRAKIAGQSITVSGAYGADGLPRDYESLTVEARMKLTVVPADVASEYWAGDGAYWGSRDGHNGAGREVETMRAWALQAFKGGAK